MKTQSEVDELASEIEQGFMQPGGWKACQYLLGKLADEQQAEIERLQGKVMCLEHVVAVLKTAIEQAHLSATQIEDHTRVRDGQMEVWCLGDWVDVEQANIEADEAAEAKEE